MKFPIIKASVVFLICSFCVRVEADEQSHFATTQYEGNQVVSTDHFAFSDHIISFKAPPNWLPLYDQGSSSEPFVKYLNRSGDCTIEVRQLPAPSVLTDEKNAISLYDVKIKEMPSPHFIKDARVRDVNMPTAFPQTYMLSDSENSPPRKIVTYLYYAPVLYEITLEIKSGLLNGKLRTDYGNLCQSIEFKRSSENSTQTKEATIPVSSPPTTSGQPALN